MYRNKKLREGANGAPCLMNGPTCNGGQGDVCLRHNNELRAGKSTGNKSHDILGFYGCQPCEWWYDGTDNRGTPIEIRREAARVANWETLIYACNEGIL